MSDTFAWCVAGAFVVYGVICIAKRQTAAALLCLVAAVIFNGVLR